MRRKRRTESIKLKIPKYKKLDLSTFTVVIQSRLKHFMLPKLYEYCRWINRYGPYTKKERLRIERFAISLVRRSFKKIEVEKIRCIRANIASLHAAKKAAEGGKPSFSAKITPVKYRGKITME